MCNNDLLTNWCREHREEQISLLKQLAAIPAPSHHEHKRAEFIRNWLYQQGADVVILDSACNVLLPFGCKNRDDITVYMAHTDVVFPDTTPLPVVERDGKLLAPGVGDDTANVVSLMMCAKFIFEHRLQPSEPVLLVFNSCEEGLGNLKGVRQLMADYTGRIREVVSFDLTWSTLVTRAVGSERWKVQVTTCGGHSYNSFGNPNAIACLSTLIGKLYQQPIPTAPDQKTTYNVGTILGGTSVNTIAQEAEMTYEYRSDDQSCLTQMRQQFLALVESVQNEQAVFHLTPIGNRPCGGSVAPQALSSLLDRCSSAVKTVTGLTPAPCSLSTDANLPLSLGIPATTVGLYQGALEHTREEYVLLDSLSPGLNIALLLITPSFSAPD
jgi:acetylornithine deacetylase/succinyl-diaminopimelate desuccinylase-like protein